MEWERIHLQSNCIQAHTDKAILINMPKSSNYKGFSFWHPRKCCKLVGKNGYLIQISFTDEFEFRLKKYGKGQYNYDKVIDEITITTYEFKKAIGFAPDEEILEELKDEANN